MPDVEEPEPSSVEESGAVEVVAADGVTVIEFAEARLRTLRRLEVPLDEALDAFQAARDEHDETHNRFRNYEWQAGDPDRVEDPELEAAGLVARAALKAAADAVVAVQDQLSKAISEMVMNDGFVVGDEVRTPNWKHRLIVASKFVPNPVILSEVTFTGDGGPATVNWHNHQLDKDGAIVQDGLEPVRFERWCADGLRVGGYIHPVSRGPLGVD